MDPRITIINERLKHVKRIIAVSSGKGGVGKSLVASALALILARKNCRVGLFDADFTSPSTHAILGVKKIQLKEEKGVLPMQVYGFKYMSIVAYSREEALPLRGMDVSNALIELFAVTRWGELDFLIIDMPPGISDATLDLIKLVKGIEFLIVTTPSPLAFGTVKKLVKLMADLKVPVVGVVENMKMKESSFIKQQVEATDLPYFGEIPFDPKIEEALGRVDLFMETVFVRKLDEAVSSSFLLSSNKL
ncbi:MAG: P-loop NTPase [Candidatus Bathyarchaeales archaeon]